MTEAELRAGFEADTLTDPQLKQALMVLFGMSESDADLIVSQAFDKPDEDGYQVIV